MFKEVIIITYLILTKANECDLYFSGTLCPGGNDRPLLRSSVPEGLRGFWEFDEVKLINRADGNLVEDESSTFAQVQRGPSYLGDNKSAFFDGNSFIAIKHDGSELNTVFWTYSFWIFFMREPGGANKPKQSCPILQKGEDQPSSSYYERSPALYLNLKTRVIEVYVDQITSEQNNEKALLTTASKLQYNKWTHIAVISTSAKIKFYANGVLDNIEALSSVQKFNDHPLFIGGVPWLRDECSFKFYMDKLAFYNTEQKSFFIQAQAQPALGMNEPASIHMGCVSCSKEQASKTCIRGYHICTSMEIYSGTYNLIRSLGWIEWDSNLWTFQQIYQPPPPEPEKQNRNRRQQAQKEEEVDIGTAICCID